MVQTMKIIAHRGAPVNAPENTLAAFRAGWSAGADGIELDVRLSADGEVVVFHDEDGRRLAGDPRQVSACTLAALQAWSIGGEAIPTLRDVLAEAPPESLVLVEIKTGPEILPALKEVFRERTSTGLIILAFDPDVAQAARVLEVPVWLNVPADRAGAIGEVIAMVRERMLAGISMGWSELITPDLVGRVHDAGLAFATWTVNDPSAARRACAGGVDLLMTDDPVNMLSALRHE